MESAITSEEVVLPVFGMLFCIVVVSLIVWAHTRKTRLKEKRVERGFTASEIEQVMGGDGGGE